MKNLKYVYRNYLGLYKKIYPMVLTGMFFVSYCYQRDEFFWGTVLAAAILIGYIYLEKYFQLKCKIDKQGIRISLGKLKTYYTWKNIGLVRGGEYGIEIILKSKGNIEPIIIPYSRQNKKGYNRLLDFLKAICRENQIEVRI